MGIFMMAIETKPDMINKQSLDKITKVEKLISSNLFVSDFYQIKHWAYDFIEENKTSKGYNDCLCVVFVKKGNFLFDLSRDSYDMHSGHIVIDKPNYEYQLRPSLGECTIFNFTEGFYRQFVADLNLKNTFFFSNPNILSLLLQSNPETEYLHFQIIKGIQQMGKLEMDNMVLEFMNMIVSAISNISIEEELNLSLNMNRLATVEMAKEYLNENFIIDISLQEISTHCCVSPFHFSRIFKKFTSYTPHQYLQNIRLKHGEMLLKNTNKPVSEISFAAGFNSIEYFATAFRQKYKINPSQYRNDSYKNYSQ